MADPSLVQLDRSRTGALGTLPVRHEVADLLPWRAEQIRGVAAQIPKGWLDAYDNVGDGPPAGITALEAIERLDGSTGVVRLEHLELVPGYRRAVAEIVAEAAKLFTPGQEPLDHTSVVYVGNGGSGAGWHIDLHQNLFVHLTGAKRFCVGAPRGRPHLRGPRAGFSAEVEEVKVYELEPGHAIYVPPFTLHRVETLEGRSVSVACSWRTEWSWTAIRLNRVNQGLRRLGLPSQPANRPRRTDGVKLAVDRVVSLVR